MFMGDVPESPTIIQFHDEAGNPALTNHLTTLQTHVYNPLNDDYGALTTTVSDGHAISCVWPSTSKFSNMPGIYTLRFHFEHGNEKITPEPLQFVIQEVNGWLTLETAREQWADAPLEDVFLYQILETAKAQCIAYAPVVVGFPPIAYVQAQLLQARAIYQSVIANQNDSSGLDGFTVRVFPLDFTIRAMLRPKRAIGSMF